MITAGLLILFFIILLVVINSRHTENRVFHEFLQKNLSDLNKEIKELKEQIGKLNTGQTTTSAQPKTEPPPVAHKPQERIAEVPKAPPVQQRKDPFSTQPSQKPIPVIETQDRKPAVVEQEEKPGWFDFWLQKNPDIEKFIGENLINKIGIGVLVLGIAFFVKYAIDKDWINETGRVANGLVAGGVLVGLAHRLRNSYRSFSSVLVGGGIAVFYTTIAFAFHEYKLIDQTAAFIIMVVITAFAVTLSILYDRIELGMVAAVGGFITPFLVSTGQNNYDALFTYMAILSTGLLVLAYFKRWQLIYFTAFLFTIFIYGAWLFNQVNADGTIPYRDGLKYATIFYFIYLAMHVVNNIRTNRKFSGFDFTSLLLINFVYYAAGIILLNYWNSGEYKGLFTASLGAINLILAFSFFRQRSADKNFIFLLIGLTLTFISLAAPVQLKGNNITLFWAAETVLLFWLYQRSGINLLKLSSVIIGILTLTSLVMDWQNIYGVIGDKIPIVINKGFLTSIVVAIALGLLYRLFYREADTYFIPPFTNKNIKAASGALAILIVLIVGILEIHYQFSTRFPETGLHFTYVQLYVLAFVCLLFLLADRFKILKDPFLRMGLPLIVFFFYLFNISNIYETEKLLLSSGNYRQFFSAQWISIVLILVLAATTIKYFRGNEALQKSNRNVFTWLIAFALVTVLSLEGRHVMVWLSYTGAGSIFETENLYYKAGMTIIWGLSSFAMMYLGMKHKFKPLRVISLVIFGATLVKLFSFDIRNIPPGGKIAAFILLGVLLLTVSFMYQRLKKLIIDDATNQG